ncbi:MAG: hypothetical protein KKI13_05850 [Candidatus Omnitrophica bacterium]|nr:hypothetical protein [Candidatus Omnitrophota bacterium]MCG2704675.1 hypothetical protein [Candidatus Omnitrophota bacterium]
MKKIKMLIVVISLLLLGYGVCYSLDEIVTVPAEDSAGVEVEIPAGTYIAQIESGGITLHFPIHPNYCWLYAVSIGTGVRGGQDEANIGTLYVQPEPKVFTQVEAEKAALKALKEQKKGTYLAFELKQKETVRFWVSDYDYSDNSGSVKVRVYSVEKEKLETGSKKKEKK